MTIAVVMPQPVEARHFTGETMNAEQTIRGDWIVTDEQGRQVVPARFSSYAAARKAADKAERQTPARVGAGLPGIVTERIVW